MGEKVYRPILKEGDHLVRSKDNEGRVRGVSQDDFFGMSLLYHATKYIAICNFKKSRKIS